MDLTGFLFDVLVAITRRRMESQVANTPEPSPAGQPAAGADAPMCSTCGTKMRPAGSCYICESCGSTSVTN